MDVMGVLLGLGLILLGAMLWLVSGLLRVVDMARVETHRIDVQIRTTWMGVFTVHRRVIHGVRGAEFRYRGENGRNGEVGFETEQGWVPLGARYVRDDKTLRQVAELTQAFIEDGQTPRLTLPTRGRLRVMLSFALIFPLGTVSFFVGVLQVLRSLG